MKNERRNVQWNLDSPIDDGVKNLNQNIKNMHFWSSYKKVLKRSTYNLTRVQNFKFYKECMGFITSCFAVFFVKSISMKHKLLSNSPATTFQKLFKTGAYKRVITPTHPVIFYCHGNRILTNDVFFSRVPHFSLLFLSSIVE